MADMPWRKAIEQVLRSANAPMHYKNIAEKVVGDGLRKNVGATPANTVNVILNEAIRKNGDKSAFQAVGNGEYILREKKLPTKPAGKTPAEPLSNVERTSEEQYDIITSFGMFWRRDYVNWASNPKLLGVQQVGAAAVDYSQQIGIYLLYDGREIIYVGRSTERPLGRRLYEHTADRLSTRWNRFSWFGLLPVSDDGTLGNLPVGYGSTKIIPALEAVLIEALEPGQNRRRGDDLSAVEYFQKEDPEIDRKNRKALLESFMDKV